MNAAVNKTIAAALLRLMRPLVRILLRHGVSYGTFADLAKWMYVDVADKDFNMPGRKQSASRISVLTGLSRKEVARLQKIGAPDDQTLTQEYNRAARVIGGWLRDARFHDAGQQPLPLPFDGAQQSFSTLVKDYSGDMPARAVLDELLRVGAVERLPNDDIRLRTRAYIPQAGEQEKLHILGTDVEHLLNTIHHNIELGAQDPFFQRKVAYDNLPEDAIPKLRQLSSAKAQALLEELDRYLSEHDRDSKAASANRGPGSGRKRAGIGIYYFEDDLGDEDS